jgi:hypothetical protein
VKLHPRNFPNSGTRSNNALKLKKLNTIYKRTISVTKFVDAHRLTSTQEAYFFYTLVEFH